MRVQGVEYASRADWEAIETKFECPIRELLMQMYHEELLSAAQIAIKLDISSSSILNKMKLLDIPRRERAQAISLRMGAKT